MRLLHTRDMVFEEFTEREIPPYAILSHRWGKDEVSYQELRCLTETNEKRREALEQVWDISYVKKQGRGFEKIRRICTYALYQDFMWIWIDTCCINKESSAELGEAINSMFNWYRKATVCYAYLSDVRKSDTGIKEQHFQQSEWFLRGWTLQELLAPSSVVFLDAEFEIIGSRTVLEEAIELATGIDRDCISGRKTIFDESVATRMSWAARRTTTRVEDLAYCLIGIFNINMPLLYGEGTKAFRRLQEEIIRSSDDETIFVHTHALHTGPQALAHHPRNFLHPAKVLKWVPERFLGTAIGSTSYTMTNKGVQMKVPFVRIDEAQRGMLLNCHFEGQNYPVIIPITPVKLGDPFSSDVESSKFSRVSQNVWRIRVHTSLEEDIDKAKMLIDIALQGRGDPFEYDTIYLR